LQSKNLCSLGILPILRSAKRENRPLFQGNLNAVGRKRLAK
jgi:hypothetical protein